MPADRYDDAYVQSLFDRMGRTYDLVNLISSVGFSRVWRRQCVRNARVARGDRVCDLMSGSGECWPFLIQAGAEIVSVDFSEVMIARQARRRAKSSGTVDVRKENALRTTLPDESVDCVVAAFGLKTFAPESISRLAIEIARILKPNGRFSLLEISDARGWVFGRLFRWYIRSAIPQIGRLCLGDIECYRMLGVYTEAFGSCERVVHSFREAGLDATVQRHFFGCATSIIGSKPSANAS